MATVQTVDPDRAELLAIHAEMDALAAESKRYYDRLKAARNKPIIVARIALVGGVVLTFSDYINYFAAKAFYSKRGEIESCCHRADNPTRIVCLPPMQVVSLARAA